VNGGADGWPRSAQQPFSPVVAASDVAGMHEKFVGQLEAPEQLFMQNRSASLNQFR
jgi:hypothetical protein